MAISSTSFKKLTPELDKLIEEIHMEIFAECDNLDDLEEKEQRLQDIEDHLDARKNKLKEFRKELTRKERSLINDIKMKLVGANQIAETGKRFCIDTIKVAGNATFNQE